MKKEHNVFGFGFFSSMETGTKWSEFHNGEKATVVQILSKWADCDSHSERSE